MDLYSEFYSSACRFEDVRLEQQLVIAAAKGDITEIKHLLSLGVSVNVEEYISSRFYDFKNYKTPLQMACDKGQHKAVKLLIEAGAKIDTKDRNGVAAIHIAAEKGHLLCLKELLHAGAERNVPTKDLTEGYLASIIHSGRMTPLHFAASKNNIDCVIELIDAGADYNATDNQGRTSLYIAAEYGYGDCVLAHLKNAIGRNILSVPSSKSGNTPLHYAVKNGMTECVKELLKLGSDPNHLNFLGLSPLHCAVNANSKIGWCSEAILKLLVLNGYNTDVNKPDTSGYTPLHYVCFNSRVLFRRLNSGISFSRRPNLAQFLMTHGANPLIRNRQGFNIIESEMRECDGDHRILNAVILSTLVLPSLHSLNIPPPLPPASPSSPRGLFASMDYMYDDVSEDSSEDVSDSDGEEDYSIEQDDYPIEQEDYPIEQEGYPIEQEDYPIEQEDYPIEQGDYPIEQEDYPIEEKDYAIEEKDYPIEEKDYPIEEKDYPIEEKDYPTEEEDYPTEGEDCPTEEEDCPTEEEDCPTEEEDYPIEEEGYPNEQEFRLNEQEVRPNEQEVRPNEQEVRPNEQEVRPNQRGFLQMYNFLLNTSRRVLPQINHDCIEEKYQWYELIASQPRTLKHHCRYQIRASLGYRRLCHIKDLRIAPLLQDYLVFKTGEF